VTYNHQQYKLRRKTLEQQIGFYCLCSN